MMAMDFEEIAFFSKEQIDRRKAENPSGIDQTLIRWAGVKSPNEIAELTGIPAEDVARRTAELLDTIDILTIEQKRARLMIILEGFIAEIDERKSSAVDRNMAAMANAVGSNVQRAMDQMEAMEQRAKVDIEALNRRRAMELVHMIERAGDRTFGELSAKYPQVDRTDMDIIFRKHLMELAAEYDEP